MIVEVHLKDFSSFVLILLVFLILLFSILLLLVILFICFGVILKASNFALLVLFTIIITKAYLIKGDQ